MEKTMPSAPVGGGFERQGEGRSSIWDRLARLICLHRCTACHRHVVDLSEHCDTEHGGEDFS